MSDQEDTSPAADYDQFVDWGKRLRREATLFRWAFSLSGAHSVLDVGAGSARHSLLFASWGMSVTAVDPDESMLAQARINVAAAEKSLLASGGNVRLVRGGFGELEGLIAEPVDALVCTGNALPHVAGASGLRAAVKEFYQVLAPGGVIILHLLNHARLAGSRVRAVPPVVRDTDEGLKVFLRIIDYPQDGESLDFDFVTLVRSTQGEWTLTHRRSAHTFIPVDVLVAELSRSGFTGIEAFGDHERRPLEVEDDESVIVVARK